MKCWLLLLFLVHAHSIPTEQLCRKWTCMKRNLNLTDSPTKEQYTNFLRNNLPEDWQNVVDTVVNACYENRHKVYFDNCPGQGMFTCIVDNLNKNCPLGSWKKEDACTTLQFSPIVTAKYIFYQGRYLDFEKNLPIERRPEFFMRKYFQDKCCDLPSFFDSFQTECDYKSFINYHVYETQRKYTTEKIVINRENKPDGSSKRNAYDVIVTTPGAVISTKDAAVATDIIIDNEEPVDPLDCCDMENFIQKDWRSECDFRLKWDDKNRLVVLNSSVPMTTTTEAPKSLKNYDVKFVPNSCEQETCIFDKLNILSNGVVDKDAFSKLLDNMTNAYPAWTKAKAKVVRLCLNKPLISEDTCTINDVLTCTFDILTENCPGENKNDLCRRSTSAMGGIVCQVSASKYRPKSRRQLCNIPNFISREVLSECGVKSVYKVEYVPKPAVRSTAWKSGDNCQTSPDSAKCVLKKMDVFNRYGFIDRFKMRNKIGLYAAEFPPLFEPMYKNILDNIPLYTNHCMTARKFLNLIDSMVTTCPYLKFKKNEKCSNLMKQIRRTSDLNTFKQDSTIGTTRRTVSHSSYHSNPIYNYGILGAGDIPPVKIIDLRPTTAKTLVILPVYSRTSNKPLAINSIHDDGIFRSSDMQIPY